jgi:signal transduction histidine kinase
MAGQSLRLDVEDRLELPSPESGPELTAALVAACEEERRRIGADLHDGLGQQLSGIACLAAALRDQLRAEGSPWADRAGMIARHASDAIDLTRAQARGLCPLPVVECGLAAGLEDLASQVERIHGVACALATDGPPAALDSELSLHLYRIAQEAISNAVRHGGADRIFIRLDQSGPSGLLVVEDNGRGLRPGDAHFGLGLRLMAHRAAAIGGAVRILSRGSNGTRIEVNFPYRGAR